MIQQLITRANIKRSVPFKELTLIDHRYYKCGRIGQILNHAVVETSDGKYCWDPNDLMRYLFPDQNQLPHLLEVAHKGMFAPHELMKFTMQMGMPLDDFVVMFGERPAAWFGQIKDTTPNEMLFDYIIRVCSKFNLYI